MQKSILTFFLSLGLAIFGMSTNAFAQQTTIRTGSNGNAQTTTRTAGDGLQTTTRTAPNGNAQTTTRTAGDGLQTTTRTAPNGNEQTTTRTLNR
ncbi:MAG: hypothetical protein AAFN40_09980 [Cyanobacteria bacterium J06560_6]